MSDQHDQSHLTVEDAGSTTRASDLFRNDSSTGPMGEDTAMREDTERRDDVATDISDPARRETRETPSTPAPTGSAASSEARDTAGGGLGSLRDEDFGHVFDQTNGMIDRAEGDSDGSAEGDVLNREERAEEDPRFDDAAVHGDGEVPEERRTGD